MSRAHTHRLLDRYERGVGEIGAACNGDLRGAVKALMLVNEQLEQKLQRISAELNDQFPDRPPRHLMH